MYSGAVCRTAVVHWEECGQPGRRSLQLGVEGPELLSSGRVLVHVRRHKVPQSTAQMSVSAV